MDALRAADEADAGAAVAPFVNRGLGGGGDRRMLGETEIIIGAEVQHRPAVINADSHALRRHNDAFVLVSARSADGAEFLCEVFLKRDAHRLTNKSRYVRQFKITLPDWPDSMASKPF